MPEELKTYDLYMSADESMEQMLCDSCKHQNIKADEEPCKSCKVSNWQPMEDI